MADYRDGDLQKFLNDNPVEELSAVGLAALLNSECRHELPKAMEDMKATVIAVSVRWKHSGFHGALSPGVYTDSFFYDLKRFSPGRYAWIEREDDLVIIKRMRDRFQYACVSR